MSFKLNNITKSFGNKDVIKNFSMQFPATGTICFFGPTGIGKTTLLNIICGIEKQDSGEIVNNNRDFSFIFQDERLIEQDTVIENVKIVTKENTFLKQDIINRSGLNDLKNELVYNLSKGQRQKLSIARALAAEFNVLLMDEPFQGLDETLREHMVSLIHELTREKLIVLVTHNTYEAIRLSDVIYVIDGSPLKIIKKINVDLPFDDRKIDNKKFIDYKNQLKK